MQNLDNLFSKLCLSQTKNNYMTLIQLNSNMFSINTLENEYIVTKDFINQIHYLDDVFDQNINLIPFKIICPYLKNFETTVNIMINSYNNYGSIINCNEKILSEIFILSNYLNYTELFKFLWFNLLDKKYYDSFEMEKYYIHYINSTSEDRLVEKFNKIL